MFERLLFTRPKTVRKSYASHSKLFATPSPQTRIEGNAANGGLHLNPASRGSELARFTRPKPSR